MKRNRLLIIAAALLAVCILAIATAAAVKAHTDFRKFGYNSSRYETFSRDALYMSHVMYQDGEWTVYNTELLGDRLVTITVEAFERTEDGFYIRARVKSRCMYFRGVWFTIAQSDQIELDLSGETENRISLWAKDTDYDTQGNWAVEGRFVCTQEEIDAAFMPSVKISGKLCVSLWNKSLMFW